MLTGKKEMRNAAEVALSSDEVALLQKYVLEKKGERYDGPTPEGNSDDVMRSLEKHTRFAGKLLKLIDISSVRKASGLLDESERLEVCVRILALINASANMVDLSSAGGSKYSGCLKFSFNKLLNALLLIFALSISR